MANVSIKKIFNYLYQQKKNNIGLIKMFAGTTIPNGWLICNGDAISRTTYSELYSTIQTTYGEGDGSTTFNLPNLVDKFPMGVTEDGYLNLSGGYLQTAIPSHIHYDPGTAPHDNYTGTHNHRLRKTGNTLTSGNYSDLAAGSTISWRTNSVNLNHTHSIPAHNTQDSGIADTFGSNLPPYVGLYYIIYTGVYN